MQELIDRLGAAFLINLPERTDRRRSAVGELRKAGTELGPGRVELLSATRATDAQGFNTLGERGCFDSHMRCLIQAHQRQARGVLVLEDDVTFSSSIMKTLPSVRREVEKPDWDIIYLGHELTGNIPRASARTLESEATFQPYKGSLQTAHSYIVNGRTVPPLIEFLELLLTRPPGDPRGGPMTIDGAYNTFRAQNPDIVTLIASPKLAWQRPSRSDLTPKRIDSIQILRPLTKTLRDLKQLISSWRA